MWPNKLHDLEARHAGGGLSIENWGQGLETGLNVLTPRLRDA